MSKLNTYERAVVETFVKTPLRTVLLVDDSFPTYRDMLQGAEFLEKFKESELALELYSYFHENQMPCDVENDPDPTEGKFEKIRKTDLILLDYHLVRNSQDPSKALSVVRSLAASSHFNTIVIYTKETDLRDVWIRVACNLGNWKQTEDILKGADLELWKSTFSKHPKPQVPRDTLEGFLLEGTHGIPEDQLTLLELELEECEVPQKFRGRFVQALINEELSAKAVKGAQELPSVPIKGSLAEGKPLWLQVGNCFVVILNKAFPEGMQEQSLRGSVPAQVTPPEPNAEADHEPEHEAETKTEPEPDAEPETEPRTGSEPELKEPTAGSTSPEASSDEVKPTAIDDQNLQNEPATAAPAGAHIAPKAIMEQLELAYLDWQPSVIQLIVSELQNTLEAEPLATQQTSLFNTELHAGLGFYIVKSIKESSDELELSAALSEILSKIIDDVRVRLESGTDLAPWARKLLAFEKESLKGIQGDSFKHATQLARLSRSPNRDNSLFHLNRFFSMEPFLKKSLTTGTVIRCGKEYFACMTPSCDLVVRKPGAGQKWKNRIYPHRPLVTIHLFPANLSSMSNAENGRFIFVEDDKANKVFSVVDPQTGQPSYEFLFLTDGGKVTTEESGLVKFDAYRLGSSGTVAEFSLLPNQFSVVGQVRESYASRILQTLGSHLSRIGVDFVNNDASAKSTVACDSWTGKQWQLNLDES